MNKELAISILRGDVLGTDEQTHEAVFMAIKALKAKPIRHGKWETEIITDALGLKHCYYACSICGKASEDEYDYCPSCGAKMDLNEVEE